MTDESPWMRLLRELFGDDAEGALEEMRRMGIDPEALAQTTGVAATPAMMDHILNQIRTMVNQSAGQTVNWTLAHDVARGLAAQGGDPTVTAAVADEHRAAVSAAELWLDAATDLDPAKQEPSVWSHAEWVEATLPTFRALTSPVAESVSIALGKVLSAEQGDEFGGSGMSSGLLSSISPTVCGMHVGQAAGALAREAFGITDVGIPLLPQARVVLVPRSINEFADGLGIPLEQVRAYVALREAAHVRLFNSAPWLVGQLHTAVARYAAGVTIDPYALEQAIRDAGEISPERLQAALNKGIFALHHTDEQTAILRSIETLLALIEGWVDVVTMQAAVPHLSEFGALHEMMRRRRATGGPAEDTFSTLLGLELRPRKMRDAAAMWQWLTSNLGASERDAIWSHPDNLPDADALDTWKEWVEARGNNEPDDWDAGLAELLAGGDPGEAPEDPNEADNTQ